METFQVIFVALIASIFAPLILATVTGRQQRMSKQQDWDRQDELAKRAEDAAKKLAGETAATLVASQQETAAAVTETASKLLASQQKSIERTDEVARLAAQGQDQTNKSLAALDASVEQVHRLVNQRLTEAIESGLAANLQLREERRRVDADDPTPASKAALDEVEATISKMRQDLADRADAQAEVDAAEPEVAEKETEAREHYRP